MMMIVLALVAATLASVHAAPCASPDGTDTVYYWKDCSSECIKEVQVSSAASD